MNAMHWMICQDQASFSLNDYDENVMKKILAFYPQKKTNEQGLKKKELTIRFMI
jgi:hypothetical protein